MLVLLSFGLVLVATVLLVLGLLSDGGLTLIYLSIAASAVAGVLLIVSYTKLGRKPSGGEAAPASAASSPASPATTTATTGEKTSAPAAATPAPVVDESAFAPDPNPATAATGVVAEPADSEADEDDFFPIADYDDLTVSQILPLLPELYADELDVVEERERSGKSRAQILGRLAQLREQLRGAPADATASSLGVAAEPQAEVTASVPAATTPRAAAKKTAAKKSTTKKAAATKSAAKKTAATKSVAKKAAPAKKAGAKKTAATKAAAPKKAAAKKTAAKKTATKKAAPAKKATKATKKTRKA